MYKGTHARLFVGAFQKSILNIVCQLLAMRAHKMAPRTSQWLKERAADTPTKGLLWFKHRHAQPSFYLNPNPPTPGIEEGSVNSFRVYAGNFNGFETVG